MYEVIIIGGGLAGLTSALHLAQSGIKVALFEKKKFPFHKFCGEYLSIEVLPYLKRLGLEMDRLEPSKIQRFLFAAPSGKQIETRLPLGGVSLTRYSLDDHLFHLAKVAGVVIFEESPVEEYHFDKDHFRIHCKDGRQYQSKIVIGSFGKRSVIDKQLNRRFFSQRSPYLGVKYYVQTDFPDDVVALFNFDGGYCGGAQVSSGLANFTYMTQKKYLTQYGNLPKMEAQMLMSNPLLKPVFEQIREQEVKPIVISNISFQPKELIVNHALMCGDAAGMIAPVCGNGMAMAIHSAKIVSESVLSFLNQNLSRTEMEKHYRTQWRALFASRLFWGRQLQKFMGKRMISELSVAGLRLLPGIFPHIIRQTHGSPIH